MCHGTRAKFCQCSVSDAGLYTPQSRPFGCTHLCTFRVQDSHRVNIYILCEYTIVRMSLSLAFLFAVINRWWHTKLHKQTPLHNSNALSKMWIRRFKKGVNWHLHAENKDGIAAHSSALPALYRSDHHHLSAVPAFELQGEEAFLWSFPHPLLATYDESSNS